MESYLFDRTRKEDVILSQQSSFTNTLDEDEKLPIPPERWINEQIKSNFKYLQEMDLIIRTEFPQQKTSKKINGQGGGDMKYVEDQIEQCYNVSASSSSNNLDSSVQLDSFKKVSSKKNIQNENHLIVPILNIDNKHQVDQSIEEGKHASNMKKTFTEINDSRQIQEQIQPIKRQTKPQITLNYQSQISNKSLVRKLAKKNRHSQEYNNLTTYCIFYFNTHIFEEINLPERVSEAEALIKVIKLFKNDQDLDKSLLKYPNIPMAYNLEVRKDKRNNNQEDSPLDEESDIEEDNKFLQHTRLQLSNININEIPKQLQQIMQINPEAYVIQVDDLFKIQQQTKNYDQGKKQNQQNESQGKDDVSKMNNLQTQGQYFFNLDPNQTLREVREQLIQKDPNYINAQYNLMLKYECSNFPKNILPYQMKLNDLPIQELIITKEQLVIVEDKYKQLTFRVFIEVNKTFEDLLDQIHKINDGTQYIMKKYRIYFKHYEQFERRNPVVPWNCMIKIYPFYLFEIIHINYIPKELLKDENKEALNQIQNSTILIDQDSKYPKKQISYFFNNLQQASSINEQKTYFQQQADKQNPSNNPTRLAVAFTYEEFELMKIEGGVAVPIVFGVDYFEVCFRRKKQKPINQFQKRVKNLMKNIISHLIEYDSGSKNKKYKIIPFKDIIKILLFTDDEKICIEYWKNPLKKKQIIIQLDININKDLNQSKKKEKLKEFYNKMMLIQNQRQIGLSSSFNQ